MSGDGAGGRSAGVAVLDLGESSPSEVLAATAAARGGIPVEAQLAQR